jgi:hypothetical protein
MILKNMTSNISRNKFVGVVKNFKGKSPVDHFCLNHGLKTVFI